VAFTRDCRCVVQAAFPVGRVFAVSARVFVSKCLCTPSRSAQSPGVALRSAIRPSATRSRYGRVASCPAAALFALSLASNAVVAGRARCVLLWCIRLRSHRSSARTSSCSSCLSSLTSPSIASDLSSCLCAGSSRLLPSALSVCLFLDWACPSPPSTTLCPPFLSRSRWFPYPPGGSLPASSCTPVHLCFQVFSAIVLPQVSPALAVRSFLLPSAPLRTFFPGASASFGRWLFFALHLRDSRRLASTRRPPLPLFWLCRSPPRPRRQHVCCC